MLDLDTAARRADLADKLRAGWRWLWKATRASQDQHLPRFRELCARYEAVGGSLDPPPWVPFTLKRQGRTYTFTPEVWRVMREFPGSLPEPDPE